MMNCFSKLFNEKKSELTKEKTEQLLKKSYNDIVAYNIETGAINKKTYNDQPVIGLRDVVLKISDFKQKWEQSSELQDLTPIMVVTKTVHRRFSEYDRYGSGVAGNVIIWDKKKKDYYALAPEWFHICYHMCNAAASEQCLYDTAEYVRNNIILLEQLAHERKR